MSIEEENPCQFVGSFRVNVSLTLSTSIIIIPFQSILPSDYRWFCSTYDDDFWQIRPNSISLFRGFPTSHPLINTDNVPVSVSLSQWLSEMKSYHFCCIFSFYSHYGTTAGNRFNQNFITFATLINPHRILQESDTQRLLWMCRVTDSGICSAGVHKTIAVGDGMKTISKHHHPVFAGWLNGGAAAADEWVRINLAKSLGNRSTRHRVIYCQFNILQSDVQETDRYRRRYIDAASADEDYTEYDRWWWDSRVEHRYTEDR